jgi:hypothetical protein
MKQKYMPTTVEGPEVGSFVLGGNVDWRADAEDVSAVGPRARRTLIAVRFDDARRTLAFTATPGQVLVLSRGHGLIRGHIVNGILRYVVLLVSIRAALRLLGPLNIASGRKVTRRRQTAGAKKWVPRPEMARSTGRVAGDTSIALVNVSALDAA